MLMREGWIACSASHENNCQQLRHAPRNARMSSTTITIRRLRSFRSSRPQLCWPTVDLDQWNTTGSLMQVYRALRAGSDKAHHFRSWHEADVPYCLGMVRLVPKTHME